MMVNKVLKELANNQQIILWGYSFLGKRVEEYLFSNGIKIDFYWDSNADKLKNEKKDIILPGGGNCKSDAKIIVCIGNNVLRKKLISEMKLKGYKNFLSEQELHILFEQVLNKDYSSFNNNIARDMTQIERLKAAISSAIDNDFEMWNRQFEYVEKLRIAKRIIILGDYNRAVFCEHYLYRDNGIKNIVGYADGNEDGISDEKIKHFTIEQLDNDAVYLVTENRYIKYLNNIKAWYCTFSDVTQNVFTNHHKSTFFENESEKILEAYDLLEDDKSREVYVETICNRIAPQYAVKTFEDLEDRKGYFDTEIFEISNEECYVDAGAYDGDSVIDFIKNSDNKYDKIYAFELEKNNFNLMLKNLQDYDDNRMELFCEGLSDKEANIQIGGFGSGAYISDNKTILTETARVVKLDDKLRDKKVTLIKMDIEGSELSALNGSENIIKNQKPKIAISAYHKIEDIWKIPLYLKGLNSEYRFYLRHHGPFTWDTDLYVTQ